MTSGKGQGKSSAQPSIAPLPYPALSETRKLHAPSRPLLFKVESGLSGKRLPEIEGNVSSHSLVPGVVAPSLK
ncbi:hypothetical protein AKJ08_3131 [Vulgatibacter incomptus]|uniref:Uncharacterized protein n=1 Tax=Vulgatibacter incomptus TaxID=1391653 RepID=A0A0K1PI22_9BACT|nr:hypothetical protein AKJ08_3131 [Vulgatibacter incomptus]